MDERYGSFVRFGAGLTGIIPKSNKGLEVKLWDTIACRITSLDLSKSGSPRISLRVVKDKRKKKEKGVGVSDLEDEEVIKSVEVGKETISVGDLVGTVEVRRFFDTWINTHETVDFVIHTKLLIS